MKKSQQRKKQLKKLAHAKRQANHAEQVDDWLNHRKAILRRDQLMHDLGYYANVSSMDINKHYVDIIEPVVQKIRQIDPTDFNRNDNRTLLNSDNYFKDDMGVSYFSGLVTNYKYVQKDNHIWLYLLVQNVYAITKVNGLQRHQKNTSPFKAKYCTDHMWLNINDFLGYNRQGDEAITIGLGDMLQFGGEITQYRGKRNGILQTKYGLKDLIIFDSGYPRLKQNQKTLRMRFAPQEVVPYYHGEQFLVKLYNAQKYNNAFPVFGNQMDANVNDMAKIKDPNYQYGYYQLSFTNLFKALQVIDQQNADAVLVKDLNTGECIWQQPGAFDPDVYKQLLTVADLKDNQVEDLYQRLVEDQRLRPIDWLVL